MVKSSLVTTLFILVLCGIVYPLITTTVGQTFFPYQVNGSLIKDNGTVIGSALIGQEFTSPKYLHGRPSPHHYSSYPFSTDPKQILPVTGGSNYSNNNPYLLQRVNTDRKTFSKENDIPYQKVPIDILTASGSGLDSQITKQSADMQINRISQHSGLTQQQVRSIIEQHTTHQTDGDIVNVLLVNLKIKQLMHQ